MQPAPRLRPRTPWHNPIPQELAASEAYRGLGPGPRATLQAIADAADAPDEAGNLLYAFGGRRIWTNAGCSRSTYWRHVAVLEAAGLLVCLLRGGTTTDGKPYANQYGIPGRIGALDHRRAARAVIRFTTDADGSRTRQVIEPGDQLPLPGRDMGYVPSRKMRLPQSQNGTPPSKGTIEATKGSKDSPVKEGSVPRRGIRVRPPDLDTTPAILELYDRAQAAGLAGSAEADRLRFVALAEHTHARIAREQRGQPHRLFAWLLNRQAWLFITADDEDRARRRLAAHDYGTSPGEPAGYHPAEELHP